jgi:hypothetical protein
LFCLEIIQGFRTARECDTTDLFFGDNRLHDDRLLHREPPPESDTSGDGDGDGDAERDTDTRRR